LSDLVAFPPEGFGRQPIFANDEIAFYRMSGFVWGTCLASAMSEDMQRANSSSSAAFALAHNVTAKKGSAQPLIDRLVAAGGTELRDGNARTRRISWVRFGPGRQQLGNCVEPCMVD